LRAGQLFRDVSQESPLPAHRFGRSNRTAAISGW
jgi:hypothetical protein